MTSRRAGETMPEKRSVLSTIDYLDVAETPPQRSSRQPSLWLFGEKGRSVRKSEHSSRQAHSLTVCEVGIADEIDAAKEIRSATHQRDFGKPSQRRQNQREKSTWPRVSREAIGKPRSRKKTRSRQLPRLQVRRPLDGSRQSAPAKRNSGYVDRSGRNGGSCGSTDRPGWTGARQKRLLAKIDTAQNDAGRISLELPGEELP